MTAVAAALRRPGGGGGGGPFTATIAPSPASWEFIGDAEGSAYQFISVLSASPIGGLAPYTYAWAALTGDAIILPNGDVIGTFFSNSGATATVKCTVTDANAVIAISNTVTISL